MGENFVASSEYLNFIFFHWNDKEKRHKTIRLKITYVCNFFNCFVPFFLLYFNIDVIDSTYLVQVVDFFFIIFQICTPLQIDFEQMGRIEQISALIESSNRSLDRRMENASKAFRFTQETLTTQLMDHPYITQSLVVARRVRKGQIYKNYIKMFNIWQQKKYPRFLPLKCGFGWLQYWPKSISHLGFWFLSKSVILCGPKSHPIPQQGQSAQSAIYFQTIVLVRPLFNQIFCLGMHFLSFIFTGIKQVTYQKSLGTQVDLFISVHLSGRVDQVKGGGGDRRCA